MATPEHSSEAHDERARDNEEARDRRKTEEAEKKERLRRMLDEGLTAAVMAQRLGVSARQIRHWKRELREQPEEAGSNRSAKPA